MTDDRWLTDRGRFLASQGAFWKGGEEIRRLRTALEFYATRENYLQGGWQGDPMPSAVDADGGNIARKVLGL